MSESFVTSRLRNHRAAPVDGSRRKPPPPPRSRPPALFSLSEPDYRDPGHERLPHVVSFSGGRSSAALALCAAREGWLRADRGDLLVFANTSAEHPGTYEFTTECKRHIEAEFGLPFLWIEFCTVEDAWRGEYRRVQSYRLVKPIPVEDDPAGYHSRGEVFEEMLAFQGMLPNPHQRTCTAKLKLYPSHKLLADWLGGTGGPAHAGHHWTDRDGGCATLVDPGISADHYKANGGTASRESVLGRHRTLAGFPPARPTQRFSDFTSAQIPERRPPGQAALPRPAPMRGSNAVQHVRLLGLRADETSRVMRVMQRCLFAEGATTSACTVGTQPPGERPYFPLHESGWDAHKVAQFWDTQPFDLNIPEGAGNCAFCFMKGTSALVKLSKTTDPRRAASTPSHIKWWADIEDRYARYAPARNGEGTTTFGFLGAHRVTFTDLAQGTAPPGRYEKGSPACDCTD